MDAVGATYVNAPLANADAVTMGKMGHAKPRATHGAGQAVRPAATSALKSAYASWMAWLRSVTCSSQVVPLMHDAPPRSGSFWQARQAVQGGASA